MKEFILNHKKIVSFFGILLGVFCVCYALQDIMIKREIAQARAAYEADLRAKGLAEPRRGQKIYMPLDREDGNRVDSSAMFIKTAQKEFGRHNNTGLTTVDYGSQANAYDQKVREIKSAQAKRLAEQKRQQEALERRMGKTDLPERTVNRAERQNTGETAINRLQTSGRGNVNSGKFKK